HSANGPRLLGNAAKAPSEARSDCPPSVLSAARRQAPSNSASRAPTPANRKHSGIVKRFSINNASSRQNRASAAQRAIEPSSGTLLSMLRSSGTSVESQTNSQTAALDNRHPAST